jgi:hypothetical protein
VEYEEVCPPGLPSQPFPVPLDLFDLPHLSEVLNLNTWHNVLSEADRRRLRQFLPGGLEEGPGGGLDQVLQGEAVMHFRNPSAVMWQGLVTGEQSSRRESSLGRRGSFLGRW